MLKRKIDKQLADLYKNNKKSYSHNRCSTNGKAEISIYIYAFIKKNDIEGLIFKVALP